MTENQKAVLAHQDVEERETADLFIHRALQSWETLHLQPDLQLLDQSRLYAGHLNNTDRWHMFTTDCELYLQANATGLTSHSFPHYTVHGSVILHGRTDR